MFRKSFGLKACATVVTVSLLCGCGGINGSEVTGDGNFTLVTTTVDPDQPIKEGSKWINSAINGAITDKSKVDIKDDFYTAVNRDWLLEQYESDKAAASPFYDAGENLIERERLILEGRDDPEAYGEIMIDVSEDIVNHDEDLLRTFTACVKDSKQRDERGIEPLRPYIEAIEKISTLDEMTDYILDENDDNLFMSGLISFSVGTNLVDAEQYSVFLESKIDLSLADRDPYLKMNSAGMAKYHDSEAFTYYILKNYGYDEKQCSRIVRDCHKIEAELASNMMRSDYSNYLNYYKMYNNMFDAKQIERMAGEYPVLKLASKYGYDKTKKYYVPTVRYIETVRKLYKESNLDQLKAYMLVNTIVNSMHILDSETERYAAEYSARNLEQQKQDAAAGEKRSAEEIENDNWRQFISEYIDEYLSEELQTVYVARYCSKEQKEYLEGIANDLIKHYKDVITNLDWMETVTKEAAIEKLDYMKHHVLYPDEFTDYSELTFEDTDTLPDVIHKIKKNKMKRNSYRAGEKVEASDWNLEVNKTTDGNAYYNLADNSICIDAGLACDKGFFNLDDPYEMNLARIGTIIGHEISHGFDKDGSQFDKYGYQNNWWQASDSAMYLAKSSNCMIYIGTFPGYPGGSNYNGLTKMTEAIADIGGLRGAASLGHNVDEFDYDLFFRTFAKMWRCKSDFYIVKNTSTADIHPAEYFRTNVSLMQVDEFYETYDIKPGDGMYMEPDERIYIW